MVIAAAGLRLRTSRAGDEWKRKRVEGQIAAIRMQKLRESECGVYLAQELSGARRKERTGRTLSGRAFPSGHPHWEAEAG
ncbi:hypothetical protein E4U43_005234 [Claviceps pusilla]|uniref:Uncharacterized protein n=1 Tax=Claviceps pusilla TaxID=123648 RepID=A0A9P7N367_9HYPO|nr:hypothetical protein E4U43_005234 [Claviceps pusilla]